jgi:hypothetical protein
MAQVFFVSIRQCYRGTKRSNERRSNLSHDDGLLPWASGIDQLHRGRLENGHAERLLGSIRKECLDHVVILGESRLAAYAHYYNGLRTDRSLAKDAALHRIVERLGTVASRPILGGLHYQYCRI